MFLLARRVWQPARGAGMAGWQPAMRGLRSRPRAQGREGSTVGSGHRREKRRGREKGIKSWALTSGAKGKSSFHISVNNTLTEIAT
jgi:hypothetical protein